MKKQLKRLKKDLSRKQIKKIQKNYKSFDYMHAGCCPFGYLFGNCFNHRAMAFKTRTRQKRRRLKFHRGIPSDLCVLEEAWMDSKIFAEDCMEYIIGKRKLKNIRFELLEIN